MRLFVAVLVSALAAECPTKPTPAPVGDAAPDAGSCFLACVTLDSLGCKEGQAFNCQSVCEHAQAEKIVDLKPTCLAAATSKESARACGTVTCP